MSGDGEKLVFVTSNGVEYEVDAEKWWPMVKKISGFMKIAPPSLQQPNQDPCNRGRWYRGRYFENGNNNGPVPDVTWEQVVRELNTSENPGGISRWQSPHYPLWIEDRIIRVLKT